MSHIDAIDVSQWQGSIDWNAVKASGVQIAVIKMGGADAGLYTDSKANANYYGAKAAGLAIGGYYFAAPGDPTNQADHFISLMSPLEQDDVMVLDCEGALGNQANVVEWCRVFVTRVHDRTGVWPMIYSNGSTWNAHDWSSVTNNCGVWVAWYGQDPEGDLPVGGKTYIMHQYTSGGSVSGIAGRVDLDAWFGSLDQFKKYGYQAPASTPAPAPEPTPAPVPPPAPVPDPPKPDPIPAPAPSPVPATPDPNTANINWLVKAVKALLKFFHIKVK